MSVETIGSIPAAEPAIYVLFQGLAQTIGFTNRAAALVPWMLDTACSFLYEFQICALFVRSTATEGEVTKGEKMKRFCSSTALAMALFGLVGVSITQADHRSKMKADLSGFQEVPAISTSGTGEFKSKLNEAKTGIDFELSYEDLKGTASAAHIHFAQVGVNGGILADLCGGTKPACPPSGTVTGTITAADIKAIPDQGIAATAFEDALRALRNGKTYVNVHSNLFPNGEIRGQIRGRHSGNFNEHEEDDEEDDD